MLFVTNILKSQNNIDNLWDAIYTNDIKLQQNLFKEAYSFKGKEKIDALYLSYLEYNKSEDYDKSLKVLYYLSDLPEFNKREYEPYLYLMLSYELANIGKRSYDSDQSLIIIFKHFLEKDFSNDVKLRLYDNLQLIYRYYYKFSDAESLIKYTKGIEDWQSVGSFNNISGSGFNKYYGVIDHPESKFEFTDRNGAKVTWFTLKKSFPNNWIDLENSYEILNSINYVQSFCYSPKSEIVQLRIGTSGSVKAWVNDRLVISESEERNNGTDSYIANIRLNEGYNRILLQLGSSDILLQNFRVRITDNNGLLLSTLKFEAEFKNYQKDSTYQSEKVISFFETQIEKNIKENQYLMINYILLSDIYFFNGNYDKATNLLKKGLKIHSKCGLISDLLLKTLVSNRKKTAANLLIEEQKEFNKYSYQIMQLKMTELINTRSFDMAFKLLDTFKLYYNENIYYNETTITLLSKVFQYFKVYKLIEETTKKFPYSLELLTMSYFYTYEKGSLNGAETMLNDYLNIYNSSKAREMLVQFYKSKGENKKIIAKLKLIEEQNPSDINNLKYIADLYSDLHEYSSSSEYLKRIVEIAPYIPLYNKILGFGYLQLGKYKEADRALETALELDPSDFRVREILRNLFGKRKIIETLEEPNLYEIYKKSPGNKEYPNDNSIILFTSTHKVFYKGGASEEKNYLLIKALTKNGIDQIKELLLPFQDDKSISIEKAEVLKSDGTKLKADVNGSHIVFTNMNVGDAVCVIYRNIIPSYPIISQLIMDKKSFTYPVPCLLQKYELLIPVSMKFNYKYINGSLEPKRDFIEGMEHYTWEKTNQKAISPEPNMPSSNEFAEFLYISNVQSWDFISNWYYEIASSKINSDFELKEVISEILPDTNSMSSLNKVKKIYNYIVENIRYSSVPFRQSGIVPQKASDIITSKIGDCKDVTTLFVALCKEIGLDATWVLVNTRSNGSNSLPLPSIDFNHCIASITLEGEKYYVELTSDLNPFGTICFDLKDAKILEIKKNNNEIENLNPLERKLNNIYRKTLISFKDDGSLVEKVETIKTGGNAVLTRNHYKNLSKTDKLKKMTSAISMEYPIVNLTKLEFENDLYTTNDSLVYNYEFEAKNYSNKISDISIFQIPLSDGMKPFAAVSVADRSLPIDMYQLSFSDDEFEELEISIPQNKTLVEVPQNKSFSNDFINYIIEFTLVGNKLKVVRNIEFIKDKILPENYNSFKEIMENIITSDQRILALRDKK